MSKPAIVRKHAAYAWAAYACASVLVIVGGLLVASSIQLSGPDRDQLTVHATTAP